MLQDIRYFCQRLNISPSYQFSKDELGQSLVYLNVSGITNNVNQNWNATMVYYIS